MMEIDRLEPRLLLSTLSAASAYQVPQYYLMVPNGFLTQASTDDALRIARNYLTTHAEDLGLSVDDVLNAAVSAQYTDSDSGLTHIYLQQRVNELEVENTALTVTVTADGKVLNVAGGFYPDASAAVHAETQNPLTANVAAQGASILGLPTGNTLIVSQQGTAEQWTVLSDSQLSLDPIDAHLAYLPTAEGLRLVWNMPLRTPDNEHWYDLSVDAYTGTTLQTVDWVDHASYNVFPVPIEAPNDGSRSVVTDPADPTASPYGWHDTNGAAGAEYTDTRGNNVSAQEDVNADNSGGSRPDGGASLDFNFPLDLTLAPSSYQSAAITNLFYWNNICHDLHFKYGFTEVAGNFQVTNYTGQGLGNDAVQADAQDGSGTNNANFATPPDGSAPRMQMFVFNYTSPYRDGDLDSEIIIHEYGHGVSNRLTGGPANANALSAIQSGGMGEGWSDWWGMMFTQKPTDTQMGSYGVGTYVEGQATSGQGIRRYPYSYDMTKDPETIAYFNSSNEVHNVGEIWCSTLWDLNWLLINKYGYSSNLAQGYTGTDSAGNILAMKLVMDALKIQPANPSFKNGRDAILQADQILTGGANAYEIWTAFARRGMGYSFVDSSASTTSVTAAYDIPAGFQAPAVTGQSPSGVSTSPISFVDLTFSLPMDITSFDVATDIVAFTSPTGADLKTSISGFSWINSNQTLRLTFTPTSADGLYSLTVGPQILSASGKLMDQNHNGTGGEPADTYTATFRYDSLVGQVINTAPAPLSVIPLPMATLDLVFNENIAASSLDITDLTLNQGSVVNATLVAPNIARYTLSGVISEGTLNVSLAAGAVTDAYGNPTAAYSTTYSLDAAVTPFPTPLVMQNPPGALIYTGSANGTITPADSDAFTLTVDPGQTVSVLVKPSAGLRPVVQLRDANGNLVGAATASAVGQNTLIQAVPTSAITSSAYTIIVNGAGTDTGTYSVQVMLNAGLENENYLLGVTNDSLATAQPLDGVLTSVPAIKTAKRGAIMCGNASISPGLWYDYYSINLIAGDILTAGVKAISGGGETVTLLNSTGTVLASGVSATNLDQVVGRFTAPNSGTYYLRISGQTACNYDIALALNAAFDIELNDTSATARSLNGLQGAIGAIAGGTTMTTLSSSYAGWWDSTGYHSSGNLNYVSGIGSTGADHHDYFVFNLASVTQIITGAQLSISNPTNGFTSNEANETLSFFDVSTTIADLIASGSGATAIFNDLGSGAIFGTKTVSSADNGQQVLIDFNADGVNAINAARGGNFAAGGALTSITPGYMQYIFGFSTGTPAQLALTLGDSSDWYSLDVTSLGNLLNFYTSTPGDAFGEFANTLNPHIELYDPSGTLVATGIMQADGRNEMIQFAPTTTGTYRVRMSAEGTSRGEYVLSLSPPGLSVAASTPGNGSTIPAPPTDFVITFSDAIDPATLQPADLTVNLIPADSVSLSTDGRTATFTFNTTPISSQGLQAMAMTTGAVAMASDPTKLLDSFSASFRYDVTNLQVTSTVPPSGNALILPGPFTFDVNFNEVIDPASVQMSDLILNGIAGASVTGVSLLPGNTTARFTLGGITSEGALSATIATGAVTDAFGNPNQAFTGAYTVDIDTLAYPATLLPVNPLGSMIYSSSINGLIGAAGDTDTFTVALDVGQTATIVVTPGAGLQPTLQLLDPNGTPVGSVSASAAGQKTLLQTLPVANAGTYRIVLGGAGAGTGTYAVQLVLNAAQETEGVLTGVSNDAISTAQALDSGLTALGGTAARTAVLGAISSANDTDYYRLTLAAGDTLSMALKGLNASSATARLYNAAGALLANAVTGPKNFDRVFKDFTAPTDGDYFIAVSSTASTNYSLVLSKNSEFNSEANDTMAQAQDILSRQVGGDQWVFGHTGAAGDSADLFRVNLAAGAALTLQTFTPADGTGEFNNSFNPRLRLLDAAGNVVAENDDSAPDGRNALLTYVNTDSNATFYVEISSSTAAGTQGEYVLRVNGNSATPSTFQVSTINPANGTAFRIAPTSVTIDFNDAILLNTVNPSDLKIDGIIATAVTVVDSDTLTFTIPAVTNAGIHTLTINGGDLTDLQGTPLTTFTSTFVLDTVGPRVLNMMPAPISVVPAGAVSIQVTFNEAMAKGNLSSDDFSLAGSTRGISYTASSYSYDATGTILTLNYANLPEDNYILTLVAGATGGANFTDALGNALDGEFSGAFPSGNGAPGGNFTANFTTDVVSSAFPVPLMAQAPLGSMIYSGTTSATIGFPSDNDAFTVNLDAGQKISVIVHPLTTTLRPAVSVASPDMLILGSAIAPAANQDAVVQTITAANAGTYTIVVSSDGLTTGMFSLQLVLNSAIEAEQHNGPSNDTLATAQNLEPATLALPGGGSIASALGTLAAGTTDIYSVLLTAGQPVSIILSTLSGTATPTITLIDSSGNPVAIANTSATNVKSSIDGVIAPATGTYGIKISATGSMDYSLNVLRNSAFDLEANDSLATAQSLSSASSVIGFVSSSTTPLLNADFTSGANGFTIDNTGGGLWHLSTGRGTQSGHTILQSFYYGQAEGPGGGGNYNTGARNYGSITSPAFTLPAGSNLSVAFNYVLKTEGSTSYDQARLQIKPTSSSTWTTLASYNGVAESTIWKAATPVSLAAYAGQSVQIRFFFDTLDNGGNIYEGWYIDDVVVGQTTATTDDDYFAVTGTAGVPLTLSTAIPCAGTGEFVNTLDPALELYDSAGNIVASDDNSAPDGRNALLTYTPSTTGTYRIRVQSTSATTTAGEYVLNHSGVTRVPASVTVASITPANGTSLLVAPTQATLTFSSPILFSTLQSGGLRLDGLPLSNFAATSDRTAIFTLPAIADGPHTFSIDSGAVTDIHNNPIDAFTSTFTLDATPGRINNSSIAAGDVRTPGSLTLTLTFNRPMLAANLDATDFNLHGNVLSLYYPASSFAYSADNTVLTITYTNLPEDSYTSTLLSGDGRFEDATGRDLDGEYTDTFPTGNGTPGGNFVLNFSLDNPSPVPFPAPLAPQMPLGSLIYSGTTSGLIGAATDTDSFTLNLDAGQKATLVVHPLTTTFRPAVTITGPDSLLLGSATAATNNQDAVLQTITAASTGTYTITVSGAGPSTGKYALQFLLNSAVEAEQHNGPSNDSLASAQVIGSANLALPGGASITSVLGTLAAGNKDFYSLLLTAGQPVSVLFNSLSGPATPSLSLLDASGNSLCLATNLAANVSSSIDGLVVPATGTYILQLTATSSFDYTLSVIRNGAFDLESNNSLVTAQPLSSTTSLLGAIRSTTTDEDYFAFQATAGLPIHITTATPSDGPGEFVNTLDPSLELYDPAGNKVAADDNGATDGRNAFLNFTPSSSGTYRLRIRSLSSTLSSGEYVLSLSGIGTLASPLNVASITPANGAVLLVAPTTATLTFSNPIMLSSLAAGALRLDGTLLTTFTAINDRTLIFTLPAISSTMHSFTLGASAVTDIHGNSIAAFSSRFFVDAAPPRITSSSIHAGDVVSPGDLTLTIAFSHPMLANNLDTADFSLHGNCFNLNYTPVSYAYNAANTVLTLTYSGLPEDSYTATLLSRDGAFEDVNGVNLDGEYSGSFPTGNNAAGGDFVLNFFSDRPTSPFPALAPVAPNGSLVYSNTTSGVLQTATDADAFTLNLQANQQLSLVMHPFNPALRPTITLIGPSGTTLASTVASAAGAEALLQSFHVPSTGTYTLTLASATAVVGQYSVQCLVNAGLELEDHGGAPNSSLSTAQNINTSFAPLDGGGSRAAILGALATPFIVPTNIGVPYTGARDFAGTPLSLGIAQDGSFVGINIGAKLNSTEFLRYGAYVAGFSVAANGAFYANNIATGGSSAIPVSLEDISIGSMHGIRATGTINSLLGFQRTIWWFDGDTYALVSTTLINNTPSPISNVAIIDNQDPDPAGSYATKNDVIIDAYGQLVVGSNNDSSAMALASPDSRAVASAEGFIVTNPFDVINSPVDPNGYANDISLNLAFNIGTLAPGQSATTTMAMIFGDSPAAVQSTYDSIAATINSDPNVDDYYALTLTAGQSLSAVATCLGAGTSALRLYDSANTLLATGTDTAANVSNAIDGFTAPSDGTYFLRVSGASSNYSLVVTRDAAFDLEPNDTIATPQPLANRTNLLSPSDSDYISVSLNAGDSISLRTYTPGDLPGMAVSNALNPAIELYNPSGSIVASDDNSAPDARNAALTCTAAQTGTYLIRVRSSSTGNTSGEYTLESHVSSAANVLGRYVFYANSLFDSPDHTSAIAPDKSALLPGQTASFANYTSYSRGINGIMFDLSRPVASLDASDFIFKVGGASPTDLDPAAWTAAPMPKSILVLPGAGVGQSTRVEILWDDSAIQNQWLQVTTLANADTGLSANDVFYFGNAVGESGDSPADAQVTPADEAAARANITWFLSPAAIDNHFDFNRDSKVDIIDQLIARSALTNAANALQLISIASLSAGTPVAAPDSLIAPSPSASSAPDAEVSTSPTVAVPTSVTQVPLLAEPVTTTALLLESPAAAVTTASTTPALASRPVAATASWADTSIVAPNLVPTTSCFSTLQRRVAPAAPAVHIPGPVSSFPTVLLHFPSLTTYQHRTAPAMVRTGPGITQNLVLQDNQLNTPFTV
jgi:Zn-dependent metalloprotease/methionine-rich copper-binding protein CopC